MYLTGVSKSYSIHACPLQTNHHEQASTLLVGAGGAGGGPGAAPATIPVSHNLPQDHSQGGPGTGLSGRWAPRARSLCQGLRAGPGFCSIHDNTTDNTGWVALPPTGQVTCGKLTLCVALVCKDKQLCQPERPRKKAIQFCYSWAEAMLPEYSSF